jgi:hypothetical protein
MRLKIARENNLFLYKQSNFFLFILGILFFSGLTKIGLFANIILPVYYKKLCEKPTPLGMGWIAQKI